MTKEAEKIKVKPVNKEFQTAEELLSSFNVLGSFALKQWTNSLQSMVNVCNELEKAELKLNNPGRAEIISDTKIKIVKQMEKNLVEIENMNWLLIFGDIKA